VNVGRAMLFNLELGGVAKPRVGRPPLGVAVLSMLRLFVAEV